MHLNEDDRVVTAWAENASGPGWSNEIIWVLVRERGGKLREVAIQPEERSNGLALLHNISATVSQEMVWAVQALLAKE